MKTAVIVVLFLVLSLGALYASGCVDRNAAGNPPGAAPAPDAKTTPGAVLKDLGAAPAGEALVKLLRPLFTSGMAFIVIGGVMVFLGAHSSGFMAVGMGVVMYLVGAALVQYPWLSLGATGLTFLAGGLEAWKHWRAKREHATLDVVTEVIQNVPEGKAVKGAIKDKGVDVAKLVRRVVDPIKDKLAKAGKIKTA